MNRVWAAKELRIGYVWRELKGKKKKGDEIHVCSNSRKVKFWVSEILHVNLLRLYDKFSSIVNSDNISSVTKNTMSRKMAWR